MTHTIGEVLNQLKDEFDDVTISKIRFLEAEGLINPDRTDSGYRQFTDGDVDRLRYILRAQRDRYLPLKVIKDELDRLDSGLPLDTPTPPVAGAEEVAESDVVTESVAIASVSSPDTDVQFDLGELSKTSGLEAADLRQLQDHGLLRESGPYGGEDVIVAKLARRLMDEGLEPRHLRMYRQFADRQAMLYQQLISPLLRQRNPDSRKDAADRLDELSEVGYRLQSAILTRELRSLLRP